MLRANGILENVKSKWTPQRMLKANGNGKNHNANGILIEKC
jgi:hypothetical protein